MVNVWDKLDHTSSCCTRTLASSNIASSQCLSSFNTWAKLLSASEYNWEENVLLGKVQLRTATQESCKVSNDFLWILLIVLKRISQRIFSIKISKACLSILIECLTNIFSTWTRTFTGIGEKGNVYNSNFPIDLKKIH